jgi:hypothetical protein
VGPTQADAQAWAGFVESRLRKLVSDNLGRSLPLRKIQLWPKKLEACVAEKSALLTQAQRQNCLTYFIGFQVDQLRMRGEELNIEGQLQKFREWDLARFQPLVQGMDLLFQAFKVKELPLICFANIYAEGKREAMKKRRKLRDEDPLRQEKRKQAKLEQLKARLAEIQRKKEASASTQLKEETLLDGAGDVEETTKKRKRSDSDVSVGKDRDEDNDDTATPGDLVEDEENLLESALDTLQGTAAEIKTREEAASDREKLLAGQLLNPTDGQDDLPDARDDPPPDLDDDDDGYAGEDARSSFYNRSSSQIASAIVKGKYKRALPIPEEDEEILNKLGFSIVGDDDMKTVGPAQAPGYVPKQLDGVENDAADSGTAKHRSQRGRMTIRFNTKFDIVELDAMGRVIDRGDDDFKPTQQWTGWKPGFEFKLGARGLGYYRTGKEVVIPSRTAYF